MAVPLYFCLLLGFLEMLKYSKTLIDNLVFRLCIRFILLEKHKLYKLYIIYIVYLIVVILTNLPFD